MEECCHHRFLKLEFTRLIEKLLRQAEYTAGVEDGLREGRREGEERGRIAGIEIGEERGRIAGIEIGKCEGEAEALKKIVRKKIQKGLPTEENADMLEVDVSVIRQILQSL